jgi:hypothetical protein
MTNFYKTTQNYKDNLTSPDEQVSKTFKPFNLNSKEKLNKPEAQTSN